MPASPPLPMPITYTDSSRFSVWKERLNRLRIRCCNIVRSWGSVGSPPWGSRATISYPSVSAQPGSPSILAPVEDVCEGNEAREADVPGAHFGGGYVEAGVARLTRRGGLDRGDFEFQLRAFRQPFRCGGRGRKFPGGLGRGAL